MIHVIGDSHVCFFLGVNKPVRKLLGKNDSVYPFFRVHYVGHATAYNLVVEDSSSKGGSHIFDTLEKIEKGSTVLLCFGEIDCRLHLPKYQNIEECVKRYFRIIRAVKQCGFKVVLWGVTSKEESKIVEDFNSYLKEKAKNEDIEVIYMYRKMVGKSEYFQKDETHLTQKAMPLVLEEFKKRNLI